MDDAKLYRKVSTYEDIESLQTDLLTLHSWSIKNNCRFNKDKFLVIRGGPNDKLKDDTLYFSGDHDSIIDRVSSCRDLGVTMSEDLSFKEQVKKVKNKASKKANWILRSFKSRNGDVTRQLWRSLVEPHLDYCSQLWSPSKSTLIQDLEAPLRSYSRQVWGLCELPYRDRLKRLKLSSTQRRHERYKIIYCYKIIRGLVPNPGG